MSTMTLARIAARLGKLSLTAAVRVVRGLNIQKALSIHAWY